jgi:hypothetical protein
MAGGRAAGELVARARRVARGAMSRAAANEPGPPAPEKPEKWDPVATSSLYTWCMANGANTRPQYLWPLIHASHAARALGMPRIAALEFGVAGGNGLLALERAAKIATDLSGTEIEIFGFDTGSGMPVPTDPRDAPFLIEPSYFAMDEQALRARLTKAQLVIGPVGETVPGWAEGEHAPIGFVAFDLDYYSSTVQAFALLDGDAERMLPRTHCYFDDTFGYGWTEYMGVHAAIAEFNESHDQRKIAKIHGLRFELARSEFHEEWHEKMYLFHQFDHPRYADFEGRLDERWFEAHRLQSG